ncbi:deoxyguanosine kinase, mitochondrial isoform X2 [Synchiropus splendidus]|uniref:deoxyguanosine kinase, mitochondrial isoform X2 n=1 Tax=Synchiropus splendidus TaxID=270530 RepID=UPI00237EB677|nr:deoxyguanosine kinase, mitochondrial isoform X2 [Synchiropus splendidus]
MLQALRCGWSWSALRRKSRGPWPTFTSQRPRMDGDARTSADGARGVPRVSIEGNIAVGKSTFARLLGDACPDWEVVTEPLDRWQSVGSGSGKTLVSNLLQMMYQEPQRWSYTFQTHSCMTRLRTQLQPPPQRLLTSAASPVQVYERSVYSDRYIFALNMFELGCINSTEWAIYQDWHSLLVEQFGQRVELEGIIYLKASPQDLRLPLCRAPGLPGAPGSPRARRGAGGAAGLSGKAA